MPLLNNPLTLGVSRAVFRLTSRIHYHRPDLAPWQRGAALLCCNHMSHYDPVCISVLLGRRVDWMARIEFASRPLSAWMLAASGAVLIDRYGAALPGIRAGLRRLAQGHRLGIYPEGELTHGQASVLVAGRVKQGVALLSIHSRVPVVPCVILGSKQFGSFVRWLPVRSGELWIGFGPTLAPEPEWKRGREARGIFIRRIEQAMRTLYEEMLDRYDIPADRRP